jgi:hypothetical protein
MIPKFQVNPPGGNESSRINSNYREDLRLEVVGCRTGESAANLGQRLWLDQQALSLISAAALAEPNDDSVSHALGLRPAGEQCIAAWQELEIVETHAAQACRSGGLHDEEIP